MSILGNLLPGKYAPLQSNGNGIQSVYLTSVSTDFAEVLMGVIGSEAEPIRAGAGDADAESVGQAV
jgi:putative restriction endonuclease